MRRTVCILFIALSAAACDNSGAPKAGAGEGAAAATAPPGHRPLSFSVCCRVPVPLDATATLPGNLVDSEILLIDRPGLRMKLDYVRSGDPGGSLVEGSRSAVEIGGARAMLHELTGSGSGRVLTASVAVPAAPGRRPVPGALTIRAECAGAADCAAAKLIIQNLHWL